MTEESRDWNVRNDLKGLPYTEILAEQKKMTNPFAVCALDVVGDLNTATMIRTACILGAEKTIIFGRRKLDRRGLVGAQNYIDIERVDGVLKDSSGTRFNEEKFYELMEQNNYDPVFIETGGTDICEMDWKILSKKPCFVFGNEANGISNNLLTQAKYCVSVPMSTVMRSFNVSVCAGIVMHEYVNRFLKRTNG